MKKLILLIVTLTCFVGVYILGTAVSIYSYGQYDETRKADVAIVLGASVAYKRVSPVYRERINHAILLYRQGYVKKIILTGGKVSGQKYSDASVARDYALSEGIPLHSILIEEKSTITQENLLYSRNIMKEKGFSTALIVSDPLHMKRAMLMAKDLDIKAYSSPTTTSMYKTRETKIQFLKNEVFVYIGYKFYRLFGQLDFVKQLV